MALYVSQTTIEVQMINEHSIDIQNRDLRQASAFYYLSNYNWNGTGSMPTHHWTAPNGKEFDFNPSNGEFSYDSTSYSSLSPAQKRGFFQYLPRFINECLKNYDEAYNL